MRWPFSRDRDGGTIIEFDEDGRVIRIPGVYPPPALPSRWRPLIYVALGAALFLFVGLTANT
jgi:hypothetical protein